MILEKLVGWMMKRKQKRLDAMLLEECIIVSEWNKAYGYRESYI